MKLSKKTLSTAIAGVLTAGSAYGGGWTLYDEQNSSTVAVLTSCNRLGVCTTPLNFNGDINPATSQPIVDLAIANDGGPMQIYLGTGEQNRGFAAMFEIMDGGYRSTGLRFADIDNDGDVEMIQTTRAGGNYIYRFRNAGVPFYCEAAPCVDAHLRDVHLGSDFDESQGLAVGDIDLDCKIDVFVVNGLSGQGNQSNKVYLNQTAGIAPPVAGVCAGIAPNTGPLLFGPAIPVPSNGVGGTDSDSRKVELVDVDADGDLDAIVANADANDNWLYINNKVTTIVPAPTDLFQAPIPLTASTADDAEVSLAIAVGDIDNDNDIDIAIANSNASNRYYLNSGSGPARFAVTGSFGPPGDVSMDVKLGDVNRDGLLDAVVANDGGPTRVSVLNGAAGEFAHYAVVNPTGIPGLPPLEVSSARSLDLGKLDNDGWLDLVVANTNGEYNLRFLNNSLCQYISCDPFVNLLPTVTGQPGPALTTAEDTEKAIPRLLDLAGVAASDGDNLPGDLRVVVEPGTNYTITTTTAAATTISPAKDYSGTLEVNAKVTDYTGVSAAFKLNVTVTPVPDAPTFTSTAGTTATQDAAYSYAITTADPDAGETRTISAPTKPAWLTLADAGNGTATLSGTPTAADVGPHSVTLEVRDAAGEVSSQSFSIEVANANDAPAFSSTAITTATSGTAYTYAITTSDPDPSDTRTITATGQPSWLTLTDNGNGTATLGGTPAAANVGNHDVSLTVTDAGGLTATQSFTIAVTAASTPPTTPPTTPPATPPASSGGGGGGSTGLLEVLGLMVAAFGATIRRRRRAA